jgi:apolipoprotein D and lipocalin family protein
MKITLFFVLFAIVAIALGTRPAQADTSLPPLQAVAHVDLKRYLGQWYEIARYPNRFQKGCLESNASYALRDDGDIEVLNRCKDSEDGKQRQSKGHAWVVDTASNAKLKVSFFWPFRGDYWIIELGREYEYAVIGTPNRKYFWILSRSRSMDDALYDAILQRARQQGFAPALVVRQKPAGSGPPS